MTDRHPVAASGGRERVEELAADVTAGYSVGLEHVPAALRTLRYRFLRLIDDLDAADWGRRSRCDLWTVDDVIRHVRDGCRLHVGALRRGQRSLLDEPFDPRLTPVEWLRSSEGDPPAKTVDDLRRLCGDEAAALAASTADRGNEVVAGPYGPVHWTIFTTHVFWDAWLHERDVTEALGRSRPWPEGEALAALYALLFASVPALFNGRHLEVTVALTGAAGRAYLASVVPGRVALRAADDRIGLADLRGDLVAVVDALAGRGQEVEVVLEGPDDLRRPLTWLRPILAPG